MKYKNMSAGIKATGIHRKEIQASGLTASTLAKKIDKHHNVILSIENGSTDPSIMTMSDILSALGMEFHEFFDERYDELFKEAIQEGFYE
ncbi:MAG: helix-turn-helix domain-containing protein [Beduini sp.]|uniref:helix-turn-helix domain-containing protein n=1 Tax=Beduini sp. TaxID=1922300 RepID=UPI0039A1890A